jgi:hypothetical protein
MKTPRLINLLALIVTLITGSALAFCGFYVSSGDAKLFNQASQVIIARDSSTNTTTITMVSDYQGNVSNFALVVPVPSVLQKDQVRTIDPKIVQSLDAYSAPRLVEYFDEDPCEGAGSDSIGVAATGSAEFSDQSSIKIEAQYSVGEYEIVVLSATESGALETWLLQNGYNIPKNARSALKPYIEKGMKFFVAKVNLERYNAGGLTTLQPLQMRFQTPNFMLPLQLGMVNAKGTQDLIVYALTNNTGRVVVKNHPTLEIPSDVEIPEFVEKDFGHFYTDLFQRAYLRGGQKSVFVEYAWQTAWCDPCAGKPPTPEELKQAGVNWDTEYTFLTRLHVRYSKLNFKDDLEFVETRNTRNFQARYILQRPITKELTYDPNDLDDEEKAYCQNWRKEYNRDLPKRIKARAVTLAKLTGWSLPEIFKKMGLK